MTKLTKPMITERDETQRALAEAHADLEAAVETFNTQRGRHWGDLVAALEDYNEQVTELWTAVAEAQSVYNAAVERANTWLADVASDIEAYMNDRSEKWADSPRGQAYSAWHDAYESATLEESELEEPAEVEVDEPEDLEVQVDTQIDLLDEPSEALPE